MQDLFIERSAVLSGILNGIDTASYDPSTDPALASNYTEPTLKAPNKEALQKYLKDNGFHKVKDTMIPFPWWKEQGLHQDMDTFWTFDFMEYRIRPGSGFTLEDVWKRVYDPDPQYGGPLLKEGTNHMILLHAHDETEEMVPGYYQLLIDRLLEQGVQFDRPDFFILSPSTLDRG